MRSLILAGVAVVAFAASSGWAQQVPAKEPPPTYRFTLTAERDGKPIIFATWWAQEDRVAAITQRASSPYIAAVKPDGEIGKEHVLETTLDLTARFWRLNGSPVLNVELNFHDPIAMNRYESDALVENLTTNGGCGFGGDYDGQGEEGRWRFDLHLNPDNDCKASVYVDKIETVSRD